VTVPGRPRPQFDLQATLACGSALAHPHPQPHHPIQCPGRLALHADGSLECEHTAVGPDDLRTSHCLDHSMALLIIELALDREFPT
jgi:hypothetical protein